MKEIEIEDDLYKYILANIEEFGETPSQILRRLLALPAADSKENTTKKTVNRLVETIPVAHQDMPEVEKKINFTTSYPSLPEAVSHGVATLLTAHAFKNEPVITNKFKMLLTAMYHENKKAFISAAGVTRGRKRNYLGQNLSTLLASENTQEAAQLKASKPREIPYTPFWVVTNANTGRKRIILTKMMTAMGYPSDLIEQIQDEI